MAWGRIPSWSRSPRTRNRSPSTIVVEVGAIAATDHRVAGIEEIEEIEEIVVIGIVVAGVTVRVAGIETETETETAIEIEIEMSEAARIARS